MKKKRLWIVVIAVVGIASVLLIFFLLPSQGRNQTSTVLPEIKKYEDLGITYLNLTEGLAAYYHLDIDYGALVTDVIPESPAALAGLKNGDIILSLNGFKTEEQRPLLGMMMDCQSGNEMVMEVWRQNHVNTVRILHDSE